MLIKAEITPEMAKKWQTGVVGTQLDQMIINVLAKGIRNGAWSIRSSEVIKISSEGHIVDGRYRVAAIAASGQAVTSFIEIPNLPANWIQAPI